MAAPAFQALGSPEKSNRKAVTPGWPTHQTFDVAFLFVEATAGESVVLSTASGFVEVAGSPFSAGTTQLSVFWARASSAGMTSPTIAAPADHLYAIIATYRGCARLDNPWDALAGGGKSTASTSLSVPGVTSSVNDTLAVVAFTKDADSTAAFASAEANASLTGLTERFDAGTTLGNGGGLALVDGTKALAGAISATTATVTSSRNAYVAIALKPPVDVAASVAGLSASSTTGSFVLAGTANVPLDRVSVTALASGPAIAANSTLTLGATAASSALGSVTADTAAHADLAGLTASAAVASPTAGSNVAFTLSRVTAQMVLQSPLPAGTAPPRGVSAASAIGAPTVAGDGAIELAGLVTATALGAVTVAASRDVAVTLAPVSASAAMGSSATVTNVAVSPSGVASVAVAGAVQVDTTVVQVNVAVNLSHRAAVTALGTVSIFTPAEEVRQVVRIQAQPAVALHIVDGFRQAA